MLNGLPEELFDELLGDEKDVKAIAKKENVTPKRKTYLLMYEKKRLKIFAEVFMSTSKDYWKRFYESTVQPMQEGICRSAKKIIDDVINRAEEEDKDEDKHIFRPSARFIITLAKNRSKIVYGLRSIRKSVSAIKRLWNKYDFGKVLLDDEEKRKFIEDFREAAADIFDPILFYIKTQILEVMSWIWTVVAPIATIVAKAVVKSFLLGLRLSGKVGRMVRAISKWSFRGVVWLLNKTGAMALGKSVLNYLGATRAGGVVVKTTRSATSLLGRMSKTLKLGSVVGVAGAGAKLLGRAAGAVTKVAGIPFLGTGVSVYIDYLYSGDFAEALKRNRFALIFGTVGAVTGAIAGGVIGGGAGSVVPVAGTVTGAIVGASKGAVVGAKIGELVGSGVDFVVNIYEEVGETRKWIASNLPAIIEQLEEMTGGHMSKLPSLQLLSETFIKTADTINKAGGEYDAERYDREILAISESPMVQTYLAYKKVILNFISKIKRAEVRWLEFGTDKEISWKNLISGAVFKDTKQLVLEDKEESQEIKNGEEEGIRHLHIEAWKRIPELLAKNFFGTKRFKENQESIKLSITKLNNPQTFLSPLEFLQFTVSNTLSLFREEFFGWMERLKATIKLKRTATYIHRTEDISKNRVIALSLQEVKDNDGNKAFKFYLNGRPVLTERPAQLWGISLFWNTDDYEVKDDGKMQNLDIFGGKAFEGNKPSFNDNEADKLERSKKKTALLQKVADELASYYSVVCT